MQNFFFFIVLAQYLLKLKQTLCSDTRENEPTRRIQWRVLLLFEKRSPEKAFGERTTTKITMILFRQRLPATNRAKREVKGRARFCPF